MARPDECAELILDGNTPSEIAAFLGISPQSVIKYLYVAVGEGSCLFSDIAFSIPQTARTAIDGLVRESATDDFDVVSRKAQARRIKIDPNDLALYLGLRGEISGDLYFFVTDLEKTLHTLVEDILKAEYGKGDEGWWRQGVPEKVRVDCAGRKERDADTTGSHAYCYTDFIHLKNIIEDGWAIFSECLPADEVKDKRKLMKALNDANTIRNKVMHPVRGNAPTDDDFNFIVDLRSRLAKPRWRRIQGKPSANRGV